MSKSKQQTLEEQLEILSAFMWQIVSFTMQFQEYVGKFELYEHLTANEALFMNEIALATQKFKDNEQLPKGDLNGKLG